MLSDDSNLEHPKPSMKNHPPTHAASTFIQSFAQGAAFLLISLLTMASASAQTGAAVPAAGGLVEKITLEARGHGPVEKTTRVQNVEGPGAGSSALQVTIPDGTEGKKYRVNAKSAVAGAIAADKPVTLTFMARSPESNKTLVMVHNCATPDRLKLISDVKLTPEWKSYKVTGEKPEAFAAGEGIVDFMMGERPGVIEISDVVLTQ